MTTDEYLVRVVGPRFVAGAVFSTKGAGRITRAAPILRAMQGMTADEARDYIRSRGWRASVVLEKNAR
jgi:hypothetical protein